MPLPEGNYFCYITEQGLKKSSSGSQFVFFEFDVVGRVMPDGTRKDRELGTAAPTGRLNLWLTDKAFYGAVRDIKKIVGPEFRSFAHIDPRHPSAMSALGKEIELNLKYETYQDRPQARWSLARDFGKPLNEAEVSSLDERLARATKPALHSELEDLPGDLGGPLLTDDDLPF